MKPSADKIRSDIQNHCSELIEQIKLLRDYATTPGDDWLARNELSRLQSSVAEIERLISKLREREG